MAAVYTTLAEAKAHLRIDFTDDDVYIAALQEMAEEVVKTELSGTFTGEGYVATTSASTTLTGTATNFSDFSVGDNIYVDGETVRTIATITDDEELTVTVAFANTDDGLDWEVTTNIPLPGGTIPLGLKQAILLLIGHFYMLREPVTVGVSSVEVPLGYKMLIAPYKNWTFV